MNTCNKDLKEIDSKLQTMNDTLIRNTSNLEVHMKRCDAIEANISKIEERTYSLTTKLYWVVGIIGAISVVLPLLLGR